MSHPTHTLPESSQAFRHFFEELREAYLERETLFTQIELALLCREHVLVVGPPGTAKSAITSAVLGRILDERTGQPSLFSKQIAESTVQTDLIGPVDFKVLTETGRTEFITEDGMLGATHAFLDEVFDGRDMLLRSILNVLHERELKHGRRVTSGRIECAVMTSNRYLSEVLARSPELLLAFADRLSFISFVPKSFARRASRAAMLNRYAYGTRPELRAALSLQQIDVLQAAVERVKVSSQLLEAVELLADELEKVLSAQVTKLPDYVPTKYFSQRSVVKALWALKAAVVRDVIYRHPDRPLEATLEDLDALRWFFLLGGPPATEAEALLKQAVDPRERAQLEILRIEQKAFDAALAKVLGELAGGVVREADSLNIAEDAKEVEVLGNAFQPAAASRAALRLRAKLVPGPRHGENRAPLLTSARLLTTLVEQRLGRGPAEASPGQGMMPLLSVLEDSLELCRGVPELRSRLASLCIVGVQFVSQALSLTALSAESLDYDDEVVLEGLIEFAQRLVDEVVRMETLSGLLAAEAPDTLESLRSAARSTRQRVAVAARRRATALFATLPERRPKPENLDLDSRRLSQLEQVLCALDDTHQGLKRELLWPVGNAYAVELLSSAPFERIEQLARTVQAVAERLRQEGLEAEPLLAECRTVLEERVRRYVKTLGSGVANLSPTPQVATSGEAYTWYRDRLVAPEGELVSLWALEGLLVGARSDPATSFLSEGLHNAVARVDLLNVQARIRFLRGWLNLLLGEMPDLTALQKREQSDQLFERLVRSRFPLLALKEGEMVRLRAVLEPLMDLPGELGEGARKLEASLRGIDDDFSRFSRRMLELRAAL